MKFIFVFIISLSLTLCCENFCYGHGECETGDKCSCYPGWGGANCNLRSCPYSDAFVDLLPGDLDHDGSITTTAGTAHPVLNEWSPVVGIDENTGYVITNKKRAHRYAECSNAGICDRNSGLCKCNSGFEGSACQRRSCPASADGLACSGHGMCLSSEASIIKNSANPALPSGWEYQKFGVCECDKGWTGISCGSRICPKGIDPVTKGSYTYTFKITNTAGSTDLINANTINEHSYKMVYDGVTYTTPLIPKRADICKTPSSISEANEDIRRAIISIPPLSQSKVSIKCTGNTIDSIDITTPYIELDLTASNGGTNGCTGPTPPNTLGYCTITMKNKPESFEAIPTATGTTPLSSTLTMTATSINVDPLNSATQKIDGDSFISCSGRGSCDETSGLCQCFDGFSGIACEKTRNNA